MAERGDEQKRTDDDQAARVDGERLSERTGSTAETATGDAREPLNVEPIESRMATNYSNLGNRTLAGLMRGQDMHALVAEIDRLRSERAALSTRSAPQPEPQDGIRHDEETNTFVARQTILTAGRTHDEARLALEAVRPDLQRLVAKWRAEAAQDAHYPMVPEVMRTMASELEAALSLPSKAKP